MRSRIKNQIEVKQGACILRVTPIKLPLGKDRGKEPLRDKEDFPWFADQPRPHQRRTLHPGTETRREGAKEESMTFLDRLQASFAASLRVPEGVAAPVALLWTDADGQWLPLLPQLRAFFPELFTLSYEPRSALRPSAALGSGYLAALRRGSRAARVVIPEGKIPILYLPRVNRQELRAAGDCPPRLLPLVELQFRGRVWHQSNGRDWSVQAFLVSEDGLGLEIAQDRRTEEAMLRVLELLAEVDLDALRGSPAGRR